MQSKTLATVSVLTAFGMVTACAEYSGKGGMSEYKVKPDAYEYHYENGFIGADAMGWDPNLQYAWSRAGAALTCQIKMNKDLVLKNMSDTYGHDAFIHDLNGISFHYLQSKQIGDFCTKDRMLELSDVIPKFEAGNFPAHF